MTNIIRTPAIIILFSEINQVIFFNSMQESLKNSQIGCRLDHKVLLISPCHCQRCWAGMVSVLESLFRGFWSSRVFGVWCICCQRLYNWAAQQSHVKNAPHFSEFLLLSWAVSHLCKSVIYKQLNYCHAADTAQGPRVSVKITGRSVLPPQRRVLKLR